MWFDDCVMYQIYPIGFCGAEPKNNGETAHRFDIVENQIPHIRSLGIDCVMFNPVVKSGSHGYDTIDFKNIDNRLGDNAEFKRLIDSFHSSGIKVIYDAVFNHVGRDFPQFKDVCVNKRNSVYKDWFYIDFNGNSPYNDGFCYKDWDGCAELVKLNLENDEVQRHLFDAVGYWIDYYGIDGLRLDVARLLPSWFFEKLRKFASSKKKDFPLIGEVVRIHEHVQNVTDDRLTSVTDYECYSGMISSVNQPNFFEIAHSIERNFARGGLFYGKNLLNFVDNHDVRRVATAIRDPRNLKVVYALMFALPGVPCIYYGSEFAAKGDNSNGDAPLRPAFAEIDKSDERLICTVRKLSEIRKNNCDAVTGEYGKVYLNNAVFAMRRGSLLYAFNVTDATAEIDACGRKINVPSHGYIVDKDGETLAIEGDR